MLPIRVAALITVFYIYTNYCDSMSNIKRPKTAYHGWLNLWKPVGMSSMQAVAAVKRQFSPLKIGHAGTLDPLADGILPIALGEATKLIPLLHDGFKTYRFGVNWGAATNTDDMEGEVIATSPNRPTEEQIDEILPQFIGTIDQIPPQFSAVKINGERAYTLARKGEVFEITARPVTIDSLQLLEHHGDSSVFEVICGTGTYVRSLARDMAEILGTKAHCAFITRVNVGKFHEESSISLEKLAEIPYTDLHAFLWPLANGLDDILAIAINDTETQRLQRGNDIKFLSKIDADRLPMTPPEGPVLAMNGDRVIAICTLTGVTLQPTRVLNT
jgi:tRNA pseudouridine55 synthase